MVFYLDNKKAQPWCSSLDPVINGMALCVLVYGGYLSEHTCVSKGLVRIPRVCLIWLSQESRGKELRGSVHGDSVSSVLALQVLITRCAGPRRSETWRPTTTPGQSGLAGLRKGLFYKNFFTLCHSSLGHQVAANITK